MLDSVATSPLASDRATSTVFNLLSVATSSSVYTGGSGAGNTGKDSVVGRDSTDDQTTHKAQPFSGNCSTVRYLAMYFKPWFHVKIKLF